VEIYIITLYSVILLSIISILYVYGYLNSEMNLILWGKYPEVIGIAGLYGSSILIFLRNPLLISIVAALVYVPTNGVQQFP
jgi:hypothetical protein